MRFETGVLGVVAFIGLAALWSLAFAGFGYAIALEDRQPGRGELELPAVLPVPVPHDRRTCRATQLSGWLDTVAGLQPGDLPARGPALAGHRDGWQWDELGKALLAIALVGAVSMSLCFAALRGRLKRG